MDLGGWLRSLGLERYEAAFRENEIDERVLPNLTAEDLKDLGVGIVGHRRKLLDAKAEQKRLATDSDGEVLVDCLHVMEKAMRYFYFKAVKEQEPGNKADQIVIDAAFNQAATLAEI